MTEDAAALNLLVAGASVNLVGDITMAVGVFILLFFMSWKLALIFVVTVPLFLLIIFGIGAGCGWKAGGSGGTGAGWSVF